MRRSLPGSGSIGPPGDNLPHARTWSAPIASPRAIPACSISPSDAPAPCHAFHGSGTPLTQYAIASAIDHRAFSAGAGSEPAAMRSMKHSCRFVISYEAPGGFIVAASRSIVPFQAARRSDTEADTGTREGSPALSWKPQPLGGPLITPHALIRSLFPTLTICRLAVSGVQPS